MTYARSHCHNNLKLRSRCASEAILAPEKAMVLGQSKGEQETDLRRRARITSIPVLSHIGQKTPAVPRSGNMHSWVVYVHDVHGARLNIGMVL